MFTIHCEDIVRAATHKAAEQYPDEAHSLPLVVSRASECNQSETDNGDSQGTHTRKLRPDMIRRVDGVPKLVNPSGSIVEGRADPVDVLSCDPSNTLELSMGPHARQLSQVQESRRSSSIRSTSSELRAGQTSRRLS